MCTTDLVRHCHTLHQRPVSHTVLCACSLMTVQPTRCCRRCLARWPTSTRSSVFAFRADVNPTCAPAQVGCTEGSNKVVVMMVVVCGGASSLLLSCDDDQGMLVGMFGGWR
jgi:hypothetical protein